MIQDGFQIFKVNISEDLITKSSDDLLVSKEFLPYNKFLRVYPILSVKAITSTERWVISVI